MNRPFLARRPRFSFAAMNDRRAVWMLLMAAFFWGSGNVANKTVLQDMDPWSAVFLRSLVAALVLLPFALGELRGRPAKQWLRSCALPSVLFAVALVMQQLGYQTATVTNASFLVNAACVLTPIIAFVVLREKLNAPTVFAAIVMLAGAFVMSGAGSSLAAVNQGDLLCLMSAVAYAAWAVALGRHAMRHGRPVATTMVHSILAAALTLPLATTLWNASARPLIAALPEILYLGVFSTALAFLLMVAAQSRVSASVAVVLTAAESLFGAAGGILILGEVPGRTVLLGAAMMLAAIMLIAISVARPTRSSLPVVQQKDLRP